MKLALLDGDSWVYRCGFAAEKTRYVVIDGDQDDGKFWLVGRYDSHKEAKEANQGIIYSRKDYEPLENCLQTVKTSLENTLNVLGVETYKLYISGRGNFRESVFPEYKANRETLGKPKYYRDIRDYLVRQWNAQIVDGMEADDALGIEGMANPESIIVSVDKDLDQIPGHHYNWVTGENYIVSKRDGLRFFYEQLLSGDPTDNVPGITGIGPVKARKALESCATPKECAQTVLKMYEQAFPAGTQFDELISRNAELLWIKRTKDDGHPFWRHLES